MDPEESTSSYVSDRRTEIFEDDMAQVPFQYAELESQAKKELSGETYDYIASGAGTGETMRSNRNVFNRFRIVPRYLKDVTARDLNRTIMGTELDAPLLVAPMPFHRPHEDGERATVRAAERLGIGMVLNTLSAISMEEFGAAARCEQHWFQLYCPTEWDVAASMVSRAESAGFQAIVITVDTPVSRWKTVDLDNQFLALEKEGGWPNFNTDPAFQAAFEQDLEENPAAANAYMRDIILNPSLTWDVIRDICDHTSLPIILKGILHPEDATLALEYGVDGIVVSNHGGRQVDSTLPSLEALPDIIQAIDGEIPVLFDSGIRAGADMFKAIALGAEAVLLGRPVLYGLALAGEQGAYEVIHNILAEFDSIVGLTGHTSIDDIAPKSLRDASAKDLADF